MFANEEAGSLHKGNGACSSRCRIAIKNVEFLRYRIIWAMHHGTWPPLLDHEDRDSLNDRIGNLREATTSQNISNGKLAKNNTSGYRGVTWNKANRKWVAATEIGGKGVFFGSFDTIEDAVKARTAGVKEYRGDFIGAG
jgi:hypothetical protein